MSAFVIYNTLSPTLNLKKGRQHASRIKIDNCTYSRTRTSEAFIQHKEML